MNEKRQKKIRAYLINFVSQELNKNKKRIGNDILIDSISLDILGKRNMQCKQFLVKEENYFYQQNLDLGYMMNINCDIIISSYNNPFNIFTKSIKKEIESTGKEGEKIEIINKETLIKKNKKDIVYMHHDRYFDSPIANSFFLQKKEISERKFMKERGEFFSRKVSSLLLNNSEREKNKEKDNVSNISENFKISKRYSNITLETELSRIIKICHDDYCSSQDRFNSESRKSEMNRELFIAKMYAKQLNKYCYNLKKKIEKNNLDDINEKKVDIKKKNLKSNKKVILFGNKLKSHRTSKIPYIKITPKKLGERTNQKFHNIHSIKKNNKTNKIPNNNNKNIPEENSDIKGNFTPRENLNKNEKGVLKLNLFKKRYSSTYRNKMSVKIKQVCFKSPKKIKTFKKLKTKPVNNKKINIEAMLKLKHEEENSKKLNKSKKKIDNKKEKSTNFLRNKIIKGKRGSMVDKINLSGFEKINFFKSKTKSSKEQYLFKSRKKKHSKKKEMSNNNNNINNNSTSISQKKDTSDSSELKSKEDDKKNNIKYRFIKKNSLVFLKRKKINSIENYKKVKKRKSNNYENIKVNKLKRISPLKNDKKGKNKTTFKNDIKLENDGKNNDMEKGVQDNDRFNILINNDSKS